MPESLQGIFLYPGKLSPKGLMILTKVCIDGINGEKHQDYALFLLFFLLYIVHFTLNPYLCNLLIENRKLINHTHMKQLFLSLVILLSAFAAETQAQKLPKVKLKDIAGKAISVDTLNNAMPERVKRGNLCIM